MSEGLRRILYAEDDPDIREIAIIALADLGGYELKVCESGVEALDSINDFEPDLFLLDVMMPGIDGPTTLKELRQIDGMANIPAIFMTAKVQPQEVNEYIEMGATGVISKPFDPMSLVDEINALWAKAQTPQ